MTRLFRSKSTSVTIPPPEPIPTQNDAEEEEFDEDEDDDDEEEEEEEEEEYFSNPMSTPFLSPGSVERGGGARNQFAILDMLVAAIRKSLVTCSVEREDVSSSSITTVSSSGGMDISWPTQVKHVSHVTFDRFNGFLGLPSELQPELPRRVPSASANVFGVSAQSMQCSYDDKGNSVPTILLMMQRRLYVEGGLKAEGIFRINAENSQEEYVRDELNNGIVPRGIDVHCLAGLIKAWFRELPSGVLDSLTPEQVMHCNTEDDCTQLVKLLPPTEGALLNWAINLMADVAEHEQYNKMNARNIAMVFAPNMTQMADPLTALIHAVQVMNLLKMLILKTLQEREESTSRSRLPTSAPNAPSDNREPCQPNLNCRESPKISKGPSVPDVPMAGKFLRCATMSRLEHRTEENYWSFQSRSSGEEQLVSHSGSRPPSSFSGPLESGYKDAFDNGDKSSLREGVRRLCRHPVFQFSKPTKKTQGLGIVNNRSGGGEARA